VDELKKGEGQQLQIADESEDYSGDAAVLSASPDMSVSSCGSFKHVASI
jgi:hypothetical protein